MGNQLPLLRHAFVRSLHSPLACALLRIRNIAEHWFEPSATRAEQEALCSLTGCSIDETRRGQATAEASKRRAEAMTAYFLAPSRFPELLIVFHTSCAAMAAQVGPARPFGHK